MSPDARAFAWRRSRHHDGSAATSVGSVTFGSGSSERKAALKNAVPAPVPPPGREAERDAAGTR